MRVILETYGDRPCIVMFLTVYVSNVTIHGLSS